MGEINLYAGSTPIVKREIEFVSSKMIKLVPFMTNTLYVLYSNDRTLGHYNVLSVGFTSNDSNVSVRDMLNEQYRLNGRIWSHFSLFEFWGPIEQGDGPIVDLLFDQIYCRDKHYKAYSSKKRNSGTYDNIFVPKQLFTSFIEKISKVSTNIVPVRSSKAISA